MRNATLRFGLVCAALTLTDGAMGRGYAGVIDGGFELAAPTAGPRTTTYFTSGQSIDGGNWLVTSGTVGVDTADFYVDNGMKSLYLTGSGGSTVDSLTQTLATTAGETYTISFYADADTNNTFSLTFGGVPVKGGPSTIAQNGFPSTEYLGNTSDFVLYQATATATSTSTALTFTGRALAGGVFGGLTVEIDDVSVAPVTSSVPEPSTCTLTSVGAVCLGLYGRYRRKRIA